MHWDCVLKLEGSQGMTVWRSSMIRHTIRSRKNFLNSPCILDLHHWSAILRLLMRKGATKRAWDIFAGTRSVRRPRLRHSTEANLWLAESLHEMNMHPVYRRDKVPIEALEEEREHMKPLPSLEYSNYDLKRAKISRYSLVVYENNYYSVPDTYRPRTITLKVNCDTIELVDGDSVIATHPRLTGKRQYSLNIAHYVKRFIANRCHPECESPCSSRYPVKRPI